MKEIICNGTPFEIGVQHGQQAEAEIRRALTFYKTLFEERAKLQWSDVLKIADQFTEYLGRDWPTYYEEIKGISEGSHVPVRSILALNVRTEIAYGMFDDGCTVLSWKTKDTNFLAQNWDWQQEQKENLIKLCIRQAGKPNIEMVSEAGIIGKIGLNSAGVGVCLNAIRAKGVDFGKLPCHMALRACLDSSSREEAVNRLQKVGVASAGHITVADPSGGIGLECSHADVVVIPMPPSGVLTHTNHFIKEHPGVEEKLQWEDSLRRLPRIRKLTQTIEPSLENVASMLKDEEGLPTAICRDQTHDSTLATLFSIRMDLGKRIAEVTVGRPTQPEQHLRLAPDSPKVNGAA